MLVKFHSLFTQVEQSRDLLYGPPFSMQLNDLPLARGHLLLGLPWFALYSAIAILSPGFIDHSTAATADRHAELLYFSLVTLSTIGYGDVFPIQGEVRMLAALEGIVGVLYIAITVALLVSAYRPRSDSA
jgi:ion channel